MRITVCGTHRVGKSTLVEALGARLPGYRVVDEAYKLLEEEGFEFSDPPTLGDYEELCRAAIDTAHELPDDAIVDRCPLDYVAYLLALDPDYDLDRIRDSIDNSMACFDLVVVVRIDPAIAISASEDLALRSAVDEQIERLVLDNVLDLELHAVEVSGSVDARVEHVLAAMPR